MKWEVEKSRNESLTLKVNNIYLYGKYNPEKDADKFIQAEMDPLMECYLLIGIGLGYHIQALLQKSSYQYIYVCPMDNNELKIFEEYGDNQLLNNERVIVIGMEQMAEVLAMNKMQLIIPSQWLKSIQSNHLLHDALLDIKTKQMSYKLSESILNENFNKNSQNGDPSIGELKQQYEGKNACLVSAGPSLNQTINILNTIKEHCFIISVGSALKVLLKYSIIPDAVIITDPFAIVKQINKTQFNGPLFYLSTVNHEITQIHNYKRYVIFQKGYLEAENYAKTMNHPILQTGGSVATTALSLLEYMGFQTVYLFGQDMGFGEGRTHADGSTSGISVVRNNEFRKVKANSGEMINTTSNLQVYRQWFERKAANTYMDIFNTAWNGASMKGIPYIDESNLFAKLGILSLEEKSNGRTV